ncbi:hypothetical protein DPEC_G00136980, partial [Dallia pectoralis]
MGWGLVTDSQNSVSHLVAKLTRCYLLWRNASFRLNTMAECNKRTLQYKQYRLRAYRHFVEWVLQGERLGKGYIVLFCLPVLFRTLDRDFQLVTDNTVAIKKLLKLWKSYECAIVYIMFKNNKSSK